MFRDVKQAAALSRTFQATQQHYGGLLRRNALFATMDEAEIDLLVSRLKPATFAAGQAIIRQGEIGDTFYVVEQGRVRVSVEGEEGEKATIDERGPGEYVGEIALLLDVPRTTTGAASGVGAARGGRSIGEGTV